MNDREKHMLRNIDDISTKCINHLESEFLIIPCLGVLNVELIVFGLIMERLASERYFTGGKMQKFLSFYENHFIESRCVQEFKSKIPSLNNDQIDLKNLTAFLRFEKMTKDERKQLFIRNISNLSSDVNRFKETANKFNGQNKVHFPYLALISIYIDPIFCYKTPINEYSSEIGFISNEINNSNIDIGKFFLSFSKMTFDIVDKYLNDNYLLLDNVELYFE